MKSPVLQLLRSLFVDLKRFHPEARGLDRDCSAIEKRLKNEGFSFLSKTLPLLRDALQVGFSTGTLTCPRNFNTVPRGAIPRLFSGMLCEVFDRDTGIERPDARVDVLTDIYFALGFFKKALTSQAESDKLDAEAVADFFRVDEEVKSLKDCDNILLFNIDRISSMVLGGLSVDEDLDGKHGPGAVYEGLKANSKWLALQEAIEESGLLAEAGYGDFGLIDRISLSETDDQNHPDQLELPLTKRVTPCGKARLVTVPKDSKSRRTITVEPVLNQFVQQGLRSKLLKSIGECSILSVCLDLSDQTHNQKLALEGSLHNNFVTLDLKSASDLLSQDLVARVLARHGTFYAMVNESRAVAVEHNDVSIAIKKFGGMGNALTFPIQSVCYAVVSMASMLWRSGKFPTYRNVRAAARSLRVYGDDIITTKSAGLAVVHGLTEVGLRINHRKSFMEGHFRESCGADCYKGVDITPCYLRVVPEESLLKDTKALTSFVDTSNQLWLKGYYSLSTAMKDYVEDSLGRDLPLVSSTSSVLGWRTRQDVREFRKWNKRLHRFEVNGPMVRSRLVSDPLDGWAALLKFFHVPLLGRSVGHLERSAKRYQSKVSWRWVAC